jgi:hypothetical protein
MKRLLPEDKVRARYGRTDTTIRRWDEDPTLGFPKPLWIRRRKYRDEAELDEFDARVARGEVK